MVLLSLFILTKHNLDFNDNENKIVFSSILKFFTYHACQLDFLLQAKSKLYGVPNVLEVVILLSNFAVLILDPMYFECLKQKEKS